jgi:hypothetical protein
MNIPGFTAEASVYRATSYYMGSRMITNVSVAVQPQMWTVPNLCTWYIFCCTEYKYPWCCAKAWQLCFPE